jgi:serine-type D-Ala-D-Ala carboxypeptidase/endopeptidase (penicillin-binding protein 4)
MQRTRTRSWFGPALAALAVAAAGTAFAIGTTGTQILRPAASPQLQSTLDQLFSDSRLAGATASMVVRDAESGNVLYSRNADQRVIPASNEKLMTSAAALEVLGTGYKFHTTARYSGTLSAGTVSGNLYLVGQGDPTLTYEKLDAMAGAVADAGITKVSGSLVADASWFDTRPLGLDWSWEDEPFAYAAPISALTTAANGNFDTGALTVRVSPGAAAGSAGVVALTPANSVVQIVNNTTTGASGSTATTSAAREHGTNTVTVSGSIPLGGSTRSSTVSVANPTAVTIGVFRDALTRHGVTVTGSTTTGTAPSTSTLVTDNASITLGQLLPYFLKLSNNGHAELLAKAVSRAKTPGSAGTWSNGLAQVASAVAPLGVDTSRITLGDGSGLTRRDYLTAAQVTSLLLGARSEPWFDAWYQALPIAGQSDPLVGGTLASRMVGTPAAGNVHAKTGTMTGVYALSGYVTDTGGRQLVFSSYINAATSNTVDILDSAAVTLASTVNGDLPQMTEEESAQLTKRVVKRPVTLGGREVECSWAGAC